MTLNLNRPIHTKIFQNFLVFGYQKGTINSASCVYNQRHMICITLMDFNQVIAYFHQVIAYFH